MHLSVSTAKTAFVEGMLFSALLIICCTSLCYAGENLYDTSASLLLTGDMSPTLGPSLNDYVSVDALNRKHEGWVETQVFENVRLLKIEIDTVSTA